MKEKNKLIITAIIILLVLIIVFVAYKLRNNISVFSAEESNNISEGMEVIMLGGTNMKDTGNSNSMRIYY